MKDHNLKTAVEAYCRRKSFRPFAIDFNNGERLVVKHPEFLMIRQELAIHFDPKKGYRLFDGASVWQVADILPDN